MSRLAATVLTFAALAAPAGAATFDAPRTLADDAQSGQLSAAPGAVAWQGKSGLWVSTVTGDARRLAPGDETTSMVGIAAEPGAQPVVTWVDELWRVHVRTPAGEQTIGGTPTLLRTTAITPVALGVVGTDSDKNRLVQIAERGADGRFGDARTLAARGRASYGLVGSGSLFVWHADEGDDRRIAAVSAGDAEADWLTAAGRDSGQPDLAVAPDGTGVLAFLEGMPLGGVRVAAIAGGRLAGPVQTLSAPGAGVPRVEIGPDGTAVVAWHENGTVRASLRRPGGTFGEPAAFAAPTFRGLAVSVTGDGDAIVGFLDEERLHTAVARRGQPFGAAEPLAGGATLVAAADADLSWIEGERIRTAHLAGEPVVKPSGGGVSGDRRKPRLRVRVLKRKGGRMRVRVRSDERGPMRVTWRRGNRVLRRAKGRLRRGVPKVVVLKTRLRRASVAIEVTDAAGNVARVKRKVK